ncbi:semaphorin-4F isoform X2 [Tympanuchus pallidicinctus]|uniref:semaphorin-4F isoform X2 n=1 Tax=Tympanuchus pallidicinctus TaxID=109042 RepID=UPI002286CF9A|nr:semaphorin-4F isoform X2 [Tympanuchus pallidicinctus]
MLRLLCTALLHALLLRAQLPPRVDIPAGDPRRPVWRFPLRHGDALLLSADEALLYVGARDAVLALNVSDPARPRLVATVPWGPTEERKRECSLKRKSPETECFNFIRVLVALNRTHLYACGTNAFSPACTHILLDNSSMPWVAVGQRDGKGQSPFDPQHSHTALLDGGELYAATANNFHGTEPIVSRSLGTRTALKTDAFLRWLADDATFVASAAPADDDQVYFFFEETALEFRCVQRLRLPRVARVCKSDVGGDKVLQKRWTTFLKAPLRCSLSARFPAERIRHVAAAPPAPPAAGTERGAEFYGVFNEPGPHGGSALCSFSRAALRAAFEGRFLEREKENAAWSVRSAPSGEARPGSCSVAPSSDQALTFMKDHFLMETPVPPAHGRPLLLSPNVSYTHIAVHQARGVGGTPYRVLFMATAEGSVHKAVELAGGRALVVESIRVFEEPQGISCVLLSASKAVLYLGHAGGLLAVPLSNCSQHRSCAQCVLARDPECAWSSGSGRCESLRGNGGERGAASSLRRSLTWLQDVEGGDARSRCQRGRSGGAEMEAEMELTLRPAAHSVLRLPCPRRSAWAAYSWERPAGAGDAELLPDLTLLLVAQRRSVGSYVCWATENGVRWAAARYRLLEPDGGGRGSEEEATAPPRPPPHGSYWPQLVAVAALLALTLPAAVGLGLVAFRARGKAGGVEKTPLNGEGGVGGERGCVQMDGGSGGESGGLR